MQVVKYFNYRLLKRELEASHNLCGLEIDTRKSGNRTGAVVFPVVKYGCESWTVKKAER